MNDDSQSTAINPAGPTGDKLDVLIRLRIFESFGVPLSATDRISFSSAKLDAQTWHNQTAKPSESES